MFTRRAIIALIAGVMALGGFIGQPALADYPEKPVTLILPNKSGGGLDINVRIILKHLAKYTDANIVVKNIAGGGTTTGTRAAYDAPKDGHTVFFFHEAFMGTSAQGILGRDFRDMIPVARAGAIDIMYAGGKNAPFEDFNGLVDFAKANPGQVRIGVQLTALNHIIALSFMDALGVEFKLINVPGGNGPMRAALIGGQVDLAVTLPSAAKAYVENGDMKQIVFMADYKPRTLPEIPLSSEVGHPELKWAATNYFFLHKDTPQEARDWWAEMIGKVMADEELQAELGEKIEDLRFSSGEELSAEVEASYVRFEAIVEKYDLKK